jgi:Cof subfamily protein (haloacid dehalogenase superfamily)
MQLNLRMFVTDLDGTLLNDMGSVSQSDVNTLIELGNRGIIRVIATGRSPYSYSKALPDDFPVDYLIFSSGAGAVDLKNKNLIYTTEVAANQVQAIVDELMRHNVDFMIHEPIPSNHRFLYYRSGNDNPDFDRRLAVYQPFCQPFAPGVNYGSSAAQVIAILPHDVEWFEKIKCSFPELKVIRATSPLDGHSIWMEIFRRDVSKAFGIENICKLTNIKPHEVATIGNDYNDLDMLSHFPNSYVVSNAPEELKNQFEVVKSNNESGFTDAVNKALGL